MGEREGVKREGRERRERERQRRGKKRVTTTEKVTGWIERRGGSVRERD